MNSSVIIGCHFPTKEYIMRFNTGRYQAPQSWLLPKGQAQTFVPDKEGVLRVQSGRAWVTMSRSHLCSDPVARTWMADDDLFLDATASLPLRAGQTIVVESWSIDPAEGVTLAWDAVLSSSAQRWQLTVAQPAQELAQGLIQAGFAFTKMLQGLLGYTSLLLASPPTLR